MEFQNPGHSLRLQNSTSNPTQTAIFRFGIVMSSRILYFSEVQRKDWIAQEQFRSEQAVVVQLRQRDAAQALVDANLPTSPSDSQPI